MKTKLFKKVHHRYIYILLAFTLCTPIIIFALLFLYSKNPSETTKNIILKTQTNTKKEAEQKPTKLEKISTKVDILTYHHIGEPPDYNDKLRVDLTVSTENFEKQVAWLKEQNYNSISLQNLLDSASGKFKLPEKPIIFTFDDGYDDVFINAVPVLTKYGYIGSFAIITQFPGNSYGTNVYATWSDIKKAKNLGMEIVSHTQDHFDGTNPKYNKKFIQQNLKGSLDDLKNNLGTEAPKIILYPYGHYNSDYLQIAKELGFRMGVTVKTGKIIRYDKLMEIPRMRISNSTTFEQFKKMILE